MLTQSLDGTQISYSRSGRGTPIVLIHGALNDGSAWQAVQPYLHEHSTLYILDRRGRGASGDTPPYAVEREIEDIEAVLDTVREPAYIVGHSSGAVLALHVAKRRPGLRGLVLYEPPLFLSDIRTRPSVTLSQRLQASITGGDRGEALRTFLREAPAVPDETIDRMQTSPAWSRMLALAHTTPYDASVAAADGVAVAGVEAIQVPVRLLLGDRSPEWVKLDCEKLAAALPHGSVSVLPGQGHTALRDAPAMVAQEVRQFCCLDT